MDVLILWRKDSEQVKKRGGGIPMGLKNRRLRGQRREAGESCSGAAGNLRARIDTIVTEEYILSSPSLRHFP